MEDAMPMYQSGSREWQARFVSTALADRLVERLHRAQLNDHDRAFIASLDYFFLATATPDGLPDCSFKGEAPGCVLRPAADLLGWPAP
jgi:hypothetical protein